MQTIYIVALVICCINTLKYVISNIDFIVARNKE